MDFNELKEKRRLVLEEFEQNKKIKEKKFKEKTIEKYGPKAIKKFEKYYAKGWTGMHINLGFWFFRERRDILCNYLNSLYSKVEFYYDEIVDSAESIYWRDRE